jgi:regulator of replication initiation timing
MYRIPAPIKPVVEMLGHTYRLLVDKVDPTGESLIKRVENAIAATGYELQQAPKKLPIVQKNDGSDNEDDDPDDEEDDLDIDEEVEPSPEERLKFQVERNHALLLDIRLCERELTEVKEARSQLNQELNELHARNGDLNLEITKLQEKLAEVERDGSDVEQLRSQLEKFQALDRASTEQIIQLHRDGFKAADILKAALKLKSNAGGAIKREIEKALPLIDDV